ncbi:Putative signal peptide peptidase SppA [Blastochloris viridis]|uniref:Macromolecule metabolism n=2 Tax=Blastochloris viridis TaxID=1079 RepID=A0A0H5BPP0_BLAVI|nr:Putative signal peptide peptidase SppA [Blastochloris viridis]BAR99623.1 macromolecule metabolism [Blastochloris viridis]CUU43097.1 Protease 4 [Blastochloris viridis]
MAGIRLYLLEMAASLSERLIYRIRPLLPASLRPPEMPVVPVVRLTGVIGFSTPLSPGMTMASVARVLERAFAVRDAKAVALIINSPGGSAVQSHLIHRRIRLLAEEAKLPVLVFVEDVAASGGYMIACAGDEIFADPSSIVGSIGVIGASFGFDKLIEKIGVERRVYTAGTRKSMLDPFRPEDPEDVERVKTIQRAIHAKFIELVKGRRGARLAAPDDSLFTGEYWEAERAKAFGLIDDIGETRTVLRQRFGDKVLMPLISAERTLFGRRLPGFGQAAEVGPGLAADVVSAIEARALWSRYGL